MCLDYLVFWCLKQRPPLPHPNPSPESTLTISVHYCDRGPSTQFHMPRVFNHCWGWHLILTVYFCACPSVLIKCYSWYSSCVETVSVDVRWCVQSYIFEILDLANGPGTRKRTSLWFCHKLDRIGNCYLMTEASRQFGLVLGQYEKIPMLYSLTLLCTTL